MPLYDMMPRYNILLRKQIQNDNFSLNFIRFHLYINKYNTIFLIL